MGTFRVGIKVEIKLSNMFAYGKLISLHYSLNNIDADKSKSKAKTQKINEE